MKNFSLRQQRPPRTQQGYMLVEALVSFMVIGVGILGAAKLNTVILQGAGTSKARAEAMLLAQSTMENARNFTLPDGCTLLASTNTGPITGTNANYTITTTYTPQYDTLVTTNLLQQNIQVTVSWEGGSDNQITLLSAVSCRGAGTSAMVGEAGASKRLGGFIDTPTGRATVGGINTTGTDRPPNTIDINGVPTNDGTTIRLTSTGDLQLIDSTDTNKVHLTVKKLACEDQAPEFSTISGKVFVKAKNGSPIVAASDLFVLSSDASYCSVLPYNLSTRKLPSTASGNSIKYFYTYYKCYIGAKWYGNIGITRTDNAPTNDRVCVGNPGSTTAPFESNLGIFKRYPQRSTTRSYRGYTTQGSKYIATGIGIPSTTLNAAGCTTYTAQHYTDHHFVVTSNIGSDADCGTAEGVINTDTSNALNANTSTGYLGNPGRFYCMSNVDGVTCPDLTDPTTVRVTVVQGTITPHNGATLTGIDNSNYYCNEYSLTQDSGGGDYHYNCTIHWTGYTSSAWNSRINFTQPTGNSTVLCNKKPKDLSVMPTTSADPVYEVNNRNYIEFTSVPNSITQIALNLNAYQGACPTTTP